MNQLLIASRHNTDLLLQLFTEHLDEQLLVLDPTGTFAAKAANNLPARYTERALYFDPANREHPPFFNVLGGILQRDHQRLTERICQTFNQLFPEGQDTLTRAQSTFLLANALRILLANKKTTLLGVLHILEDKIYRTAALQKCHDPVVRANWAIINTWKDNSFIDLHAKLGTLLMSPIIRNIVGQEDYPRKPRIVIANLNRAELGDTTARLLGGLLLIRSTGQVIINDADFLPPANFPEERFTVAYPYLPQDPELRAALLGIEEKYVFRVSKRDANELAYHVNLTEPRILTELEPDEFRTRTKTKVTEPSPKGNRLKSLQKRTRARYTRPRMLIEAAIARTMTEASHGY